MIVVLLALLAGVSLMFAQERGDKLLDRLLRPNLSMTNPAQNKTFAAGSASLEQRVQNKTFHAPEELAMDSFGGTRTLSPREFAVRHFRIGDSTVAAARQSQFANAATVQVVSAASVNHAASENGHSLSAAPSADNRPFLGQGKSQRALRAYDRPLTIEQVRELLNKNK